MTHMEGPAHSRYPINGPNCWGLGDDDDDEDEHTREPLPAQSSSSTALTQPQAPRPSSLRPRMPDLQPDSLGLTSPSGDGSADEPSISGALCTCGTKPPCWVCDWGAANLQMDW